MDWDGQECRPLRPTFRWQRPHTVQFIPHILGACWCPVSEMKVMEVCPTSQNFPGFTGRTKMILVWAYKSNRAQTGVETELYLPPSVINWLDYFFFIIHQFTEAVWLFVYLPPRQILRLILHALMSLFIADVFNNNIWPHFLRPTSHNSVRSGSNYMRVFNDAERTNKVGTEPDGNELPL